MAAIGTLKTEFNRTYIYLNPNPYQGPPTWRLSNIPVSTPEPDNDGFAEIYTLLPINKTTSGSTVNLFFDIDSLPSSRQASTSKNYISTILSNFLSAVDMFPQNSNYSISKLNGVDPIKTNVVDKVGVVYFDMSDLPSLEDVRRNRRFYFSSRTFKYNSRSVDSLTATEPLDSQVSGGTATVSLDFSTLPEA